MRPPFIAGQAQSLFAGDTLSKAAIGSKLAILGIFRPMVRENRRQLRGDC
jgi:hypothetical protein